MSVNPPATITGDVWGTQLNAAVTSRLGLGTATDGALDKGPQVIMPQDVAGNGYCFEIRKDTSALAYKGNTRAAFVVQHRDTVDVPNLGVVPGAVFQFVSTGNGVVVPAAIGSYGVFAGMFVTMTKSGDASGHCHTASGELGAIGAGGYNELGGFQGEFTNTGSTKGTISGVEVVVKDSPDAGVTKFDTRQTGVGSRIVKYDAGRTMRSMNYLASSEGTVAPDSIFTINETGFQQWVVGFDLTGATFTSGVAMRFKNNTNLSWLDSSAAAVNIVGVDASDVTTITPSKAAGSVKLRNFARTQGLSVDGTTGATTMSGTAGATIATFSDAGTARTSVLSDGTLNFINAAVVGTTVGAAGAAAAMPTPAGYLFVYIGGVAKRVAYFN